MSFESFFFFCSLDRNCDSHIAGLTTRPLHYQTNWIIFIELTKLANNSIINVLALYRVD